MNRPDRQKASEARTEGEANMRLLFVGDVMLGRLMNTVLRETSPAYPWGDTLPLFHQADVRICNLECVVADRGTPWSRTPKVFHFRSDATNVASLTVAHIDAVSLANNHTLDFEEEGLVQMLTILDAAGIHHAGAGRTLNEASAPALWNVQGDTLGLLAFTDNEPAWAATSAQAGVWYVPMRLKDSRAKHLFAAVKQAKETVDVLIVSAHWGPNWGHTPPSDHIAFAHALIEAGADIIFGHSGHVVRGIEIYKQRPILYCTGDFVNDYAVDPSERNDRSGVFVVETDGQRLVRLLLHPIMIQACHARRAGYEERAAMLGTMQKLCTALHTATIWNERQGWLEIQIQ
jgi:poly-gamma-glutamate capsule biosynthesis protein CapA/YwtB (metallophosphatase superfamily)